jgi:hypothetical protein
MTDTEYKKEILLQKIEMHRRMFHLELQAFQGKVSPITSIFSFGQEASQALGSVGSLVKTISGGGGGSSGTTLSSLLAVVLPAVKLLFDKGKK